MLHQTVTPPAGPKAARTFRGSNTDPRPSTRAGVHKRRNAQVRVSPEGDLIMKDVGATGAARTNEHRRPGQKHGRGGSRSEPGRGGISLDVTQKAILRTMASGASKMRGSRTRLNAKELINDATNKSRNQRPGLQHISVTGWRKSKAASNHDGGVADLIAFLERKSNVSDAGPARIIKVC